MAKKFHRDRDGPNERSFTHSMDNRHKSGQVIPGHGPLEHGKEVVCAHADCPSVGHDGPFAIADGTKLPVPDELKRPLNDSDNPATAANAQFNGSRNPARETTRPDQIVASGATGFPAKG